jgi:hypothetical protein
VRDRGVRDAKPVRLVLEDAVAGELPTLVERLRDLGLRGEVPADKVVRVPIAESVLSALAFGREQTGLPAITLLGLCLQSHVSRKRRRPKSGGGRRKASPGDASAGPKSPEAGKEEP